jgi:hypothetical protein
MKFGMIATARVILALLAAAPAVRAADDPRAKFEVFCREWMGKLAARERDNVSHIRWVPTTNGVQGEYVGYSADHTCLLKHADGNGSVPIGQIIYKEFRYQKRGESPTAAANMPPQAIEATEVTEIFRYQKGKWEY